MKTSVDKLFDENHALELEKAEVRSRIANDTARLDEIEQRQAEIRSSVQVKSAGTTRAQPTRRRVAAKPRQTSVVKRVVAAVPRVAPPGKAKSEAERVRDYIAAAPDDAVITTDDVATAVGIRSATASTALGRLMGKLIERVPGSKRGKFRKINRAA